MVKVMYQPSCSVNIVPILPCLHISQQDGIVLDFHDKNAKKHRENIVIFTEQTWEHILMQKGAFLCKKNINLSQIQICGKTM